MLASKKPVAHPRPEIEPDLREFRRDVEKL